MGLLDRGFGAGSLDTVSELGAKSAPIWVPAIIGMFSFGLGGAINGFAGFVIQNGVTNVCVGMAVRGAEEKKLINPSAIGVDFSLGLAFGYFLKFYKLLSGEIFTSIEEIGFKEAFLRATLVEKFGYIYIQGGMSAFLYSTLNVFQYMDKNGKDCHPTTAAKAAAVVGIISSLF